MSPAVVAGIGDPGRSHSTERNKAGITDPGYNEPVQVVVPMIAREQGLRSGSRSRICIP